MTDNFYSKILRYLAKLECTVDELYNELEIFIFQPNLWIQIPIIREKK